MAALASVIVPSGPIVTNESMLDSIMDRASATRNSSAGRSCSLSYSYWRSLEALTAWLAATSAGTTATAIYGCSTLSQNVQHFHETFP